MPNGAVRHLLYGMFRNMRQIVWSIRVTFLIAGLLVLNGCNRQAQPTAAKGTVNTLEQLETLIAVGEARVERAAA